MDAIGEPGEYGNVRLSPDGRRIAAQQDRPGGTDIWLPAVDAGYSPYDTTPDGRRFPVRATPEHSASQPLTVIFNWPARLKDVKK